MKITIGEWKTRGGEKATVAAGNDKARDYSRFIGWVDGIVCCWYLDGARFENATSQFDLIAPWTDPVPWDWSTTPPWINWIVLSPNGFWWMHSEEPIQDAYSWIGFGECAALIPQSHHPKWSGEWKLSKTMRPKETTK